jgi:PmbA protein
MDNTMFTLEYMLDRCKRAVDIALKHNADEAESFMLDKEVITIRLARSSIVEAKAVREKGMAIRIVKDKRIAGSSTSLLDDEHIQRAVGEAISSTSMMQRKDEWISLPSGVTDALDGCYDRMLEDMSVEDTTRVAYRMLDGIDEELVVSGVLHVVKEYASIANSNGINMSEKSTYIIGSITADYGNDYTGRVSGVGFNAARTLRSFNAESIAREASEMALNSRNASKAEMGTYSIIFEPYALGELLSFVFAYNFNAKAYQDKRSCFHGSIGKSISVDELSILDEPRRYDGLGSKSFDDEGVATYNKYVVEDGVMKGLVYDSFYAYKDNVKSTGNAVRSGYPVGRGVNPLPYPSFHNIVVRDGSYRKDEIIKDTKHGLIVGRLWYTYAVNPEQGDFSCTARSGIFEVKDGEVIGARRMVRIVDNLKRVLMNISAIGRDSRQILQWHAIPCITPSIRVDGVRIVPL